MRKIKRIVTCAALLAVILTLAACGEGTPASQATTPPNQSTATPPAATAASATASATVAPPSGNLPQSGEPFALYDVVGLIRVGSTIGDVADLINADSVSWAYLGDATGETMLTLHAGENYVSFIIIAPEGSNMEESWEEYQPLAALPELVPYEEAFITDAQWCDNSFALPFIRGVGIGASADEVLRAFLCEDPEAELLYSIKALNPKADDSWASDFVGGRWYENEYSDQPEYGIQYVYSDVEEEDQWRVYYSLYYVIEDDEVALIRLEYLTDPE